MVSGKKSNSRTISPHLIGTPVPPLHAASPFRMSGTQKRRRGRREPRGEKKKWNSKIVVQLTTISMYAQ